MRYFALPLFLLALPATLLAQVPKEKPILILDPGGHTQEVAKVVFTPDNKQLISVAANKTIRIWDVDSGEQLRVLCPPSGPGIAGSLTVAALSPNGQTLAVGTRGYWDGNQRQAPIYLINLDKGTMQQVLRGHTDTISSLAYSKDGERLASGGGTLDPNPRVWNLDKDQASSCCAGHGPTASR
jgi:WD40 repeat protein